MLLCRGNHPGQFVRAALSAGQRTRGIDLSFTEPYLWGRISGGVDLFAKRSSNSRRIESASFQSLLAVALAYHPMQTAQTHQRAAEMK